MGKKKRKRRRKLTELRTKSGRRVFEIVTDPNDTGEDFDPFTVPLIRVFPHHNLTIGGKAYRNPRTEEEKKRVKRIIIIYVSIIAFVLLVEFLTWLGL